MLLFEVIYTKCNIFNSAFLDNKLATNKALTNSVPSTVTVRTTENRE